MALVGDFASSPVDLYTVKRENNTESITHTFTKYGNKMDFYNISINMQHRPVTVYAFSCINRCTHAYAYHTTKWIGNNHIIYNAHV